MEYTLSKQASVDYIEILDRYARAKIGSNCYGISFGYDREIGGTYPIMVLKDGTDTAEANTILSNWADPVITITDLEVAIKIGDGTLLNDSYECTASSTDVKTIKIGICVDDSTEQLELVIFQKTTGVYGDLPSGKTYAMDLAEYTIAKNGTELVGA